MPEVNDTPALIGLDWGTTFLRSRLFAADGRVLDRRTRPHGMRALPPGGFAAALAAITAGWPPCPRLACGMAGARGGWREVPYRDVPAGLSALAAGLGEVTAADGAPVWIVPGVCNPVRPDVMRGEETQVLGALAMEPELSGAATFILPGTHCKWVTLRAGQIVDVRTRMTGELFALLIRHSMLAVDGSVRDDVSLRRFADGVRAARDSGAAGGLSRLFAARARMLMGELPPEDVPGWLSGLLIGEDIRSVLADGGFPHDEPVRVIGDPALCDCYRQALAECSLPVPAVDVTDTDTAMQGLWQIAVEAGLVAATQQERAIP